MIPKRIERANELIRAGLGQILNEHFRYQDSLISITEVDTAPDLRSAKVFISVFPNNKKIAAMEALKRVFPRLQTILHQKLNLKYAPKIFLVLDEDFEYKDRIEGLFRKIEKKNGED